MTDRPLTKNIDLSRGALSLKEYVAAGGYAGARAIANGLEPSDVLERVKNSGLKGRGGAGFPTGLKWSFVPKSDDVSIQRYLVVNADEMEPGTFKDRMLMEGDPHLLIEGMIIAAYTIQATRAFIFLRGEYFDAERSIAKAIAEARDSGYLGRDIFGTGFDFDIVLHTSAGRYICGEETALLNALEGKRANPRAKPPFPQVSGLWGKPTIVNNVETLCNLPGILAYGVEWYQSLGSGGDFGTKLSGMLGAPVWSKYSGSHRRLRWRYAGGLCAQGVSAGRRFNRLSHTRASRHTAYLCRDWRTWKQACNRHDDSAR